MAILRVAGDSLCQWDTGRKVLICVPANTDIKRVDFKSCAVDEMMGMRVFVEEGRLVAEIPNIMLQYSEDIKAYVVMRHSGDEERTILIENFEVEPKDKPPGYVCDQQEIKRWDDVVVAAELAAREVVNEGVAEMRSNNEQIVTESVNTLKAYNDTNVIPLVETAVNASTASAASAKVSEKAAVQCIDSVTVAQEAATTSATSAMNAEASANEAKAHAQAMAGTFDFTGYLRYKIVDEVPTEQENGVIYIVRDN